MSRPKQEIAEELESLRKIVRMLRKRRFILEEQMAAEGIQARPQTVIEVESLIEQIGTREREIAQLETIAVEDQLPLAEAQYQEQLAEAWNSLQGRPTVIGMVRLELERLRLGIVPERAKELEQSIRARLAEERIMDLRLDLINTDQAEDHLRRVVCAWRYDPATVSRVFRANARQGTGIELPKLLQMLQKFAATTIWTNGEELRDFHEFLDQLQKDLYGS